MCSCASSMPASVSQYVTVNGLTLVFVIFFLWRIVGRSSYYWYVKYWLLPLCRNLSDQYAICYVYVHVRSSEGHLRHTEATNVFFFLLFCLLLAKVVKRNWISPRHIQPFWETPWSFVSRTLLWQNISCYFWWFYTIQASVVMVRVIKWVCWWFTSKGEGVVEYTKQNQRSYPFRPIGPFSVPYKGLLQGSSVPITRWRFEGKSSEFWV